MAGEELQVVRLRDDFYRDGFYKIVLALAVIVIAIILLVALSIYIYLSKPAPVYFSADNEWRILQPVPLDKPYLHEPDLIQWVSEAIPNVFTFDFLHYSDQLKGVNPYFTPNGLSKFLALVNVYANADKVQNSKLFISCSPSGAPFIINQGELNGRYGWWVQMPITLNYITVDKSSATDLVLQVLVVRVSTLDNLYGVAIDNMITTKGGGEVHTNG
ncbi:MAG: DotI/IcmL/TraM family protein [Gammaproteobacteria bacterium]